MQEQDWRCDLTGHFRKWEQEWEGHRREGKLWPLLALWSLEGGGPLEPYSSRPLSPVHSVTLLWLKASAECSISLKPSKEGIIRPILWMGTLEPKH